MDRNSFMIKIKFTELANLDDYKNLVIDCKDYAVCRRPLFHGTRRYALECGEEVLQKNAYHSIRVVKAVQKYYHDNKYNPDFLNFLNDYYEKSNDNYFISPVVSEFGKCGNYEYGDFYLTSNYLNAIRCFASFGMGELGYHAYRNAIVLRKLKIDLGVEDSIDYLLETFPKFDNSERVILMIDDAKFADLLNEYGDITFRPITKEYNFDTFSYDLLYEAETTCNLNYQLMKLEKYHFKLIKESLLKEGFACFGDIKDAAKI